MGKHEVAEPLAHTEEATYGVDRNVIAIDFQERRRSVSWEVREAQLIEASAQLMEACTALELKMAALQSVRANLCDAKPVSKAARRQCRTRGMGQEIQELCDRLEADLDREASYRRAAVHILRLGATTAALLASTFILCEAVCPPPPPGVTTLVAS